MAELAVVGERFCGEEYLGEIIDRQLHGHGAELSPVSRILRMLRYPDQRAIIWPDVLCEMPPLREGEFVRLPVIRQPLMADLSALDWFADYAASVRSAAMAAMARARTEEQRMMIALQMAGRQPRRVRSVYVLTRLEVLDLADHPGEGLCPGGEASETAEGRAGSGAP